MKVRTLFAILFSIAIVMLILSLALESPKLDTLAMWLGLPSLLIVTIIDLVETIKWLKRKLEKRNEVL